METNGVSSLIHKGHKAHEDSVPFDWSACEARRQAVMEEAANTSRDWHSGGLVFAASSIAAGRLRRPNRTALRSSSFLRCSCETVSSVSSVSSRRAYSYSSHSKSPAPTT